MGMTTQKLICLGVLTFLLCSSLTVAASPFDPSTLFTEMLIRIDISSGIVPLPKNVEIASEMQGEYVDIILPAYRLSELTNLHVSYTTLIPDLDAYDREMMGSYHSFAQIENILQGIATNYSNIATLFSIGTSYQNRSIWCLEVSDNPGVDEGEPGVFFMGVHHAREWPGAEICLHIANNLTSLYGIDDTITDLVNSRRVWIVPVVNPDGYYYCHDQGNDWRKNRHYFPQYGTTGVDLNRNYNGSCDGNAWGAWGSIADASVTHYPADETYCGPGATSELEIQAISNFFLTHDVCTGISWHTYQEELYWPWGYTASHTPDDTYISQVGTQVASRITRQSGSGTYTPGQSHGLYGTTGDNIDWEYGYSHYVLGHVTFPFTIEACSEFHPSASYLNQICKENCDGAIYLVGEAQTIHDTVIPRVMPPVLDEMSNNSPHDYTVSWQEKNPDANPDYFQLDQLTNFSTQTDDAESGSGLWNLDGFTISTARCHSGSHSYYSRHSDSDVSSMTTTTPLLIRVGMNLSFWCWYSTEENYDDAFVEVSRDGRYYEVLDIFTGSSGGWCYKTYDLSKYAGDSLFIRFRSTTDQGTLKEGFYVDDVFPTASFGTVQTLSDTITADSYAITNQPNGTYYYRVKGHNEARGWCDFSTLKSITVTGGGGGEETNPVLVLENFAGGFGKVSISVKNIGTEEAMSVNLSIHVTGGLLGLINNGKTVTLTGLPINETRTITTDKLIFGLGTIHLSASASCPEATPPVVSKNATGKILIIFITGITE